MANYIAPLYTWRFFLNIPNAPSRLCAGVESVTENINSQNKQYFFLCQDGNATNGANGIAPQYTVSGRRVYGDAVQEYVAGLKYKFGRHRKSVFHMERSEVDSSGNTVVTTVEGPCTIMDISDVGGNTTDDVPFSFTIALDGKPEVQTIVIPPLPTT